MYHAIATADFACVPELIREHTHPPLYFWILWVVARWSDSAVALRLPALAAGLALVPAMFLLVRRWAGLVAGIIAAAWVCLSPGALAMSQVARPYALQQLCLSMALLGLCTYLRERWRSGLALYLLAACAALFLHYSTFLVFAGVALALLGLLLARRVERSRWIDLGVAHAALLGAAAYVFVTQIRVMQGGEFQAQAQTVLFGNEFIHSPGDALHTLRGAVQFSLGGIQTLRAGRALLPAELPQLSTLALALFACAVALMALGLRRSLRAKQVATVLFPLGVLAAAIVMALAGQYPLGNSRHSSYLLVVFVPLLAAGLADLLETRRRVPMTLAAVYLVASVTLLHMQAFRGGLAANPPSHFPEQRVPLAQAQEVRQLLLEELPGDTLLVTDWQAFQLLTVLLGPASTELATLAGTQLQTLRAGERTFVFGGAAGSPPWRTWELRWRRAALGEGAHLSEVMDALEAGMASGELAQTEAVWFVDGGWGANPAAGERGRPGEAPDFLSRTVGGEGLGAFLIDRAAYRDYLSGG